MEGTMDLEADRCDITITRSTKGKNAPMQEFSAVYTGTNVPVKGMTGSNAGEMLTGVSKDVFRRSAFIAQGNVGVTGSPELEKRISSIVTTGEESCSWSEADERLRAWQRRRRYNRKGLLPELEGRMDETQRRLEEMSSSVQDAEELDQRLREKQAQCEDLEKQMAESRKRQRREALERLSRSKSQMEESSARHDRALETLSDLREQLRQDRFGLREPDGLEAEAAEDLETLASLRSRAGQKSSPIWTVLLVALAMLAAALSSHLIISLFRQEKKARWLMLSIIQKVKP
jgi:DNA repair exonuclease SbcCD ATPase subunit